jgi:hypothetical protein
MIAILPGSGFLPVPGKVQSPEHLWNEKQGQVPD